MIIVANWKAKVADLKTAKALVATARKINDSRGNKVIVAPPFPFLAALALPKTKLTFAGQDVSATDGGAQTGEVTAPMLVASGARYVIIGHSERRALGDTDAVIALKVQKALAAGLVPIVCIGEHERDPEAAYLHFVRAQVQSVYETLSKKDAAKVILAYEPVWAIGKSADESVTPEDLTEMVNYIRKVLAQLTTKKIADETSILYGGAVEAANAYALTAGTGVAGVLVGHASTEVKSFSALVKTLSRA